MKKYVVITGLLLVGVAALAQQRKEVLEYIDQYKQVAVAEMVRARIPASITLAQGILESAAGKSPLSLNSNNHFGIKCKDDWTGRKYYHDDDAPQECFRVYDNPAQSYADHSDFLTNRPRYAGLFQLPITDYKSWSHALKSAGYATNPRYAYMLIEYIETYGLSEHDKTGMALMEQKERRSEPAGNEVTAKVEVKHERQMASAAPVAEPATVIVNDVRQPEARRTEFVVNGVRAIRSEGQEDPLKIAMEFEMDYARVMVFNDMATGDKFKPGQYIYLQPKKARGSEATYTVQSGESMHDISQKLGIKLRDLYARNLMKQNDQPHAGEKLYLQDKRTASPKTMSYADYLRHHVKATGLSYRSVHPVGTQATAAIGDQAPVVPQFQVQADKTNYEVKPKDTLYSIARLFDTTVDQLRTWNGIDGNNLREGQTLVVYK